MIVKVYSFGAPFSIPIWLIIFQKWLNSIEFYLFFEKNDKMIIEFWLIFYLVPY